MKKIYLVLGGESCGNHLATNLLVAAGIKRGTTTYDDIKLEEVKETDFPIVYRRSFPHGGEWCNLHKMLKPLFEKKLITKWEEVFVIVPVRNWFCSIRSAVKRGHSLTAQQALDNLKRAYKEIFSQIKYIDYMIFPYDEIVNNPPEQIAFFYENISLKVSPKQIIEIVKKINNPNFMHYSGNYDGMRPTERYSL